MYSYCQTIHPATTVEHSVRCNFYNSDETNLVVAGSNQITVYRIINEDSQTNQLEFMQSFEVYGTVASMQKISLVNKTKRKRDALVLSFHDAKLSIVEYNPEIHDLKTISMHYFEDDTLRDGCVTNHMHPPLVRVDPEDRCISMLIYGRHVVVMPVDKDEEEDLENGLYPDSPYSTHSDQDDPMLPFNNQSTNQIEIQKPLAGQVAALRPAVTPSFRSPVLPSYMIDLSEETCGEKIDNIVDIQFLHNYNDPTLVILYETSKTWSGRIAMKQDTFSMVALSMNVHQRLQPIIWTVNNLPYDSQKILPVPKPIGGLLIIGCNELIYLNQSVPAFGMSFNSFAKEGSSFPLKDPQDTAEAGDKVDYINISLDLSHAVFLNHNKILFILKDGDVYLVTLFNDDMRSIKNFHFERIASTVQPSCLTLCENNILFIGSHVGDSVLAEIVGDLEASGDDDDLDAIYDENVDDSMSAEEKEPIRLEEQDKIMSTSACGCICYGEAPNISDNLHHDHRDPYVELITAAGHHQNGAICVFQRTIKPFVDDTYELKDCDQLWTMKPSAHSESCNWRLILNREFETMVFSTKGELLELKREDCAFSTSEPTIFAANIGEDDLTVQVMSTRVLLISNDKLIHDVRIENDIIVDACLAGLYIIVLTRTGATHPIELQTMDGEIRQYRLTCHPILEPHQLTDGRIIALTLYKDESGLFASQVKPTTTQRLAQKEPATFWLSTVDERGVLCIFSVPDFRRVYSVDNFPAAPNVLAHNVKLFVTDLDMAIPKTKEIFMCALGRNKSRPLLFVRSDSELVIYEAYRYADQEISNNHLKIRFKKIHTLLLKTIIPDESNMLMIEPAQPVAENMITLTNGRERAGRGRHYDVGLSLRERCQQNRHWISEFKAMAGYSGVFLAGFRPHWFFMNQRGALRAHPMNVEGSIYAFSQHEGDNFIYYTEKRELKIARLPAHLNLDYRWPVRKIPMNGTVHFVNYHVERKIYSVVTSISNPCLKVMKVGSEPDTMKSEDLEREYGYIPPTTEKCTLQLYDPEKWECIPDCEIQFEEWEQVTCVKNVLLASEGTTSGLKGYIALSTNYCYGEDVPNRGRIWILDLIEVVPEPDRPLTKNKIKTVYCQEQRGPVTALSHCCGLLMSAVGQKIYLWQLREETLDGVAFIDTQIYIHCAASVKNLILVSDVCKSVSLLRYQEGTRTLSMVCRDSKPLEVFACDFLIDNELLNFVVADSEKNFIIYVYDPESDESFGGTRLIRRADFHIGAHLTNFSRIRARVPPSLHVQDKTSAYFARRKHITMYGTVDGAVGYLYPINEDTYRQLQMLQNEMTMALPHVAGLNPKAWRTVKQARPSIINPCKSIIDGDLIGRFLSLSVKERNELTKKTGTTANKILATIQMIQESTLHF